MGEAKYEPHFDAPLQGVVVGEGNTINIFADGHQQRLLDTPLPPSVWTVPYPRNLFFTAREDMLEHLHTNLLAQKATALTQPQAINGLGGIGKTQLAVEYAHRHREYYPYVFWMNAATIETLIKDFMTLAKLLGLSISSETEQERITTFVRNWLDTHERWLLIMDNADTLDIARPFLPTANTGHIILTTREQAVGSFTSIEVEKMTSPESILLLLRRAKVLNNATPEDRKNAEAIAREMDGLPLALDQAGAYIEEKGCTVATYLHVYTQRQAKILSQRGRDRSNHADPVATTWSLSFEHVEQQNPLAADLMRCCAFLAPDDIPEEFFTKGAHELSPLLKSIEHDASLLDEAIGELRRFSLVRRNRDNHSFSIHRLVQAILRTNMDEATQRVWAERTVQMVNQVFPGEINITTWKQCQRYIAHAQTCATAIEHYHLAFPEAADVLVKTADYLQDLVLYTEAEPLFQRAWRIREQVLGPEHPHTASSLNDLASLYYHQGKYEQAEPLLQKALRIREQVLGPEHPHTATSLNDLALLYYNQSKYEQAEPLYQRALRIREQVLGPEHPHTATSLNNLAALYYNQGKYEQAEALYQRALRICEQVLGSEHPATATCLNNLAALYNNQGKYEQAEPLYQRALRIREQVLGPEHPDTATSLNDLALLYDHQGKYEQAEPLSQRALQIYEQMLGPEHPHTKTVHTNYTQLLGRMKRKKK